MKDKKDLRKIMLPKRGQQNSAQKKAYDTQICEQLWAEIQNRNAKVVHAYLPMGQEIDIWPLLERLLEHKIQVICPKTLKNRKLDNLRLNAINDIEKGLWGTEHPANSTTYTGQIDFIIVPGLAFDAKRNRLGYGGGYYDNFLIKHPEAYKLAICYPFQIVEEVPTEAHDFVVDEVLYFE